MNNDISTALSTLRLDPEDAKALEALAGIDPVRNRRSRRPKGSGARSRPNALFTRARIARTCACVSDRSRNRLGT